MTMKSNGTYQVLITWSAPAPIGVDLNPQRYTVAFGEYRSMAAAQRQSFRGIDWLKVLFADDSSAVSIEYYDCSAVFLNGLPDVIGDTIQYLDNGGDFEETRADVEDFENYAERTECDRMVIGGTDVYWTAYAKHTDVRVETRPLPYDFIRQVAHASVTEQAVA